MKKTLLAFSFMTIVGLTSTKAAELSHVANTTSTEYVVNDENIDMLFATSTDASYQVASTIILSEAADNAPSNQMYFKGGSSKSAFVAILLDFFVGGLGIHRAYLGTKTFTWVGYILTCGGIGGLVPLVDLIVLAVNAGDISKYEDNDSFFMW